MKPRTMQRAPASAQAGVSLLEVLVALLILSFGILGTVGMMFNGLKQSSSADYRSVAAEQATAMADEMRASATALSSSSSAVNISFDNLDGNQSNSFNANCVETAGCTRNSYLQNAYYLWKQQVANALPAGSGMVCYTSTPNLGTATTCPTPPSNIVGTEHYVVKVCWNEQRINASAASAAVSSTNIGVSANSYLCTWALV